MSSNQPFRMRPIYDILLYGTAHMRVGLYQLHIATAEQLTRLHYSPNSIKLVKQRLKVLADHGYIQPDAIPTKRFKSPYYYTLGTAGVRYLEGLGVDTNEAWRASNEVDKHGLFIAHTLELNDVIIAAALLKTADPRYYLESFIHERVLKRRPYKASLQGEHGPQTLTLIPDAYLYFGNTENVRQHFSVLLEHDRGTEEQSHFKRKIRAYLAFIHAEAYRQMFDTSRITIAFTTFQGEKRLQQMREWTYQALVASNEPLEVIDAFRFAAFQQPLFPGTAWLEPQWHYSYRYDRPPLPLLAA